MEITRCTVQEDDVFYPNSVNRKCIIHKLLGQVPARFVLYLLSWSGFMVSFMMRTDINLTIVAMVEDPVQPDIGNLTDKYCYVKEASADKVEQPVDYGGTLKWSSGVQSYILASFYWAYILSHIVGGVITQKFGTKRVFGYGQLTTALCSLCIPWASETHYILVILLRSIQGLASGLTWPAMYALVGYWIPFLERSRFLSSFQGYSFGIGLTYPLSGFLISHLGWRSVFYTTGSIGIIWCIIWYLFASDSPETHPRISRNEQQYIKENTINTSRIGRQGKVPWVFILCSMPAWSIGITTFGRIWAHCIFIVSGPKYMKTILGFSIEKNGVLSGLPSIISFFATVVFCYIADKLITHNVLSLTNVRKLFTALAQIVPGILCIVIGYLGCDINAIVAIWFVAIAVTTAGFAGAMANIVDIAPNFAGPVVAFVQTVCMTACFISTLTVGYFTKDGYNVPAWRNVFNVTGGVTIFTYLVYQIWGTGEVQSWNYINDSRTSTENEAMALKESKNVDNTNNSQNENDVKKNQEN